MDTSKDITTEQLILETAEKLFLEKGFAMTSTTEIARQAGCNQALVHYYFRTKENLFQSIFEKKFRFLISSFLQTGQPEASFEVRLKQIIESHYELIRSNPKLPFLIFNELITNPLRLFSLKEKLQEVPKPIFMQLERELNAEITKGNIRPISIFDLLITMLSLNVMVFLGTPIIKNILQLSDSDMEILYEQRKQENVKTILNSLRP